MSDTMSLAYRDGWLAHANGVLRNRNPFDDKVQLSSHMVWDEGWGDRDGDLDLGVWDDDADDTILGG